MLRQKALSFIYQLTQNSQLILKTYLKFLVKSQDVQRPGYQRTPRFSLVENWQRNAPDTLSWDTPVIPPIQLRYHACTGSLRNYGHLL